LVVGSLAAHYPHDDMHDFKEFLADVFNEPSEYLPMFVSLGVLLAIWSILLIAAICSRRCTRPAWRLALALAASLPALLLISADIPMVIEKNQSVWRMDLSWLFLVPLILGSIGVYAWWKAQQVAPPNSRPPCQLPSSGEARTPDSQRAPSSGGCG